MSASIHSLDRAVDQGPLPGRSNQLARFAAWVLGGTAVVTSITLIAVLTWLTNGFSGEPVPTPIAITVIVGWIAATAVPAIWLPRSLSQRADG
ncbi:MAG: hypothetical protein SF002_07295 [Alphaproteobacteria bacterium]|nr:hypothetical protein [Alphaproteobacteria bacterium]